MQNYANRLMTATSEGPSALYWALETQDKSRQA